MSTYAEFIRDGDLIADYDRAVVIDELTPHADPLYEIYVQTTGAQRTTTIFTCYEFDSRCVSDAVALRCFHAIHTPRHPAWIMPVADIPICEGAAYVYVTLLDTSHQRHE